MDINVRKSRLLTNNLVGVANNLQLEPTLLAHILGLSIQEVMELINEESVCEVGTPPALRAAYFIKIIHLLSETTMNSDELRDWLYAKNSEMGGIPLDLMKDLDGLKHVYRRLEAA